MAEKLGTLLRQALVLHRRLQQPGGVVGGVEAHREHLLHHQAAGADDLFARLRLQQAGRG